MEMRHNTVHILLGNRVCRGSQFILLGSWICEIMRSILPGSKLFTCVCTRGSASQSASQKGLLAATDEVSDAPTARSIHGKTTCLKQIMAAPEQVSIDSVSYIITGEYFFIGRRAKNDTGGFYRWKRCHHSLVSWC